MAGAHARLSGSSAERFMNCAGSVALAEIMPPDEEDEYASEGTAAHAMGERALREEKDAYHYIGQTFYEHVATAEMATAVQVYLDFVREELGDCGMLVEERIEDPTLGPDFGGQVDAAGHRLPHWIKLQDFKYGIGIPVEVVDNAQMWYYAFGIIRRLEVKRGDDIPVHITIVQPRAYHYQGPIRTQIVSSDAILAWGEDELIPAFKEVERVSPEVVAPYSSGPRTEEGERFFSSFNWGEHCRFCPAKLICHKAQENYDQMAETTEDEIEGFDDDTLAARYAKIATVKYTIKALQAEAQKRAMASSPLAGTKLIYGKGSRVWKEGAEDELIKQFGEDAYTDPELKSPAQIEELAGGTQMTGRWGHKQKGKPTLVPENASGEPYDPSKAGEGFAAVPTGE